MPTMNRAAVATLVLATLMFFSLATSQERPDPDVAPYRGWQYSASFFVLTTPAGADLPAATKVEGFPLLVRLHRDWFDFTQAKRNGEDIRFSNRTGIPLPYQVEEWDAAQGSADIWVRVPQIKGNEQQELRVHWGRAEVASESSGEAVFNPSNGYLSVWHMGDAVRDEVGTLETRNVNTTTTLGRIGKARHFAGGQGAFAGDKIMSYPSAGAAHTTEAWFRAEKLNTTIIGWGNEGGGRGSKVRMQLRSPPHVRVDSDFSDIMGGSRLSLGEWIHVAHTYGDGPRRLYINGRLDGEATTKLDVKSPARLWLGGWYHNYDFVGEIDEVRVSKVARSADWVRLEFENQKPLQTLVGPLVQAGTTFAVSPTKATVLEGQRTVFTAQAGGARKVFWSVVRDNRETVVAVDQLAFQFNAGRVTSNTSETLRFKAILANEVKTRDIPITVQEDIAEPVFSLKAPRAWDGRKPIEIVPQISNLNATQARGASELKTEWSVSPMAVVKEFVPGKVILTRAQNSGRMTVTATISNGGKPVTHSATIMVKEPKRDAWVVRAPGKDEIPEDGQFYARDGHNEGTLHCNGTLDDAADSVFLKLYADDKLVKTATAKPGPDKSHALAVRLKPGLIKYKVEFGTKVGGQETVRHTATNIVCGDAYLIDGQSNALATDTGEKSPPETNEWVRSYGRPPASSKATPGNLWCNPVWKAEHGEKAELGWWGMELARRLVESQQVPIFIINAAAGGTRIDQHQRTAANPTDLNTLYGRMLWRVQQAKLTHGIRAILWHQGENDQGADGPTGGYGWETYQPFFVEMSAGWKRDFPNVQHYYIYQIWPNSCSMGGRDGAGDRLREKQRTLPRLYSNMSIMSTLGIRPPGGCHFPLAGWSEFARLIQPLIERDNYGKVPAASITPPNLQRASFAGGAKDTIALEFDQPVVWSEALTGQFYLDGRKGTVASGNVVGNVLTLKLRTASMAQTITYLKEVEWSQETLLKGANGIAALTFCEVPILPSKAVP